MFQGNPYRDRLKRLRAAIHAARQLIAHKPSELVKLNRKIAPRLAELAEIALDTCNPALFFSALVLVDRYCAAIGVDPEAFIRHHYGSRAALLRGPNAPPICVCTICGRLWRPHDPGWTTWQMAGEGWLEEKLATCSPACARVLQDGDMPGYVSFGSDKDIERYAAGIQPEPPRLPPPKGRKRTTEVPS